MGSSSYLLGAPRDRPGRNAMALRRCQPGPLQHAPDQLTPTSPAPAVRMSQPLLLLWHGITLHAAWASTG